MTAMTPRATTIPTPAFAPVLRPLDLVPANEDTEFEEDSDGIALVTLEVPVVVAVEKGSIYGVSVAVLTTVALLDNVANLPGAGAS